MILPSKVSGINKNKETSYFKQIDNLMKEKYLSKFGKNESNRNLIEIVENRDFIRKDSSIVLNPENLKIYLWILIIPEIIKPYMKNQTRRTMQKLMYDWLYKYSHKKLDKLFTCEFFSFLFKEYVECGGFKKMMKNDETLSRNKDTYQEAWNYFLSNVAQLN